MDTMKASSSYRKTGPEGQLPESGVEEATGDPKFDKMLKGITGKRQVAKQQKADTKQQARDAFGGMFGGGNPADKLSIRNKGVAEGSDEFEVQLDGQPVPGPFNDFDHARNKASKLISYQKGEVAEVYVNGKLKMRLKLNTPHQHFDEHTAA